MEKLRGKYLYNDHFLKGSDGVGREGRKGNSVGGSVQRPKQMNKCRNAVINNNKSSRGVVRHYHVCHCGELEEIDDRKAADVKLGVADDDATESNITADELTKSFQEFPAIHVNSSGLATAEAGDSDTPHVSTLISAGEMVPS
jgi:hypothetical protein